MKGNQIRLRILTVLRLSCLVFLAAFLFYALAASRSAVLEVKVLDAETGEPSAARILITDSFGEPLAPPEAALAIPGTVTGIPEAAIAVMYGRWDRPEGFSRLQDGAFYAEGGFQMKLPQGDYRLRISKGHEYRTLEKTLALAAGQRYQLACELERWINMPERGWYSSDDHVHIRRSPREDPLLLRWFAAEDIHVGNLLQVGNFLATYWTQYAFGAAGRYQEGEFLLLSGQEEPRTPEIGHTISLGGSEFVRFQDDYYRYDKVFDRIHELGGICGYSHQGVSYHAYRGMSLDVIQGNQDFLELLQFCNRGSPLHLKYYYHFLDLGFPLTATAGSDFPFCGRGPKFGFDQGCSQIGDARFYTYLKGPLDFEKWFEGLKAGRTFVSSGPMLELTVNGKLPGSTLHVSAGTNLEITAQAVGEKDQVPLQKLELVGHGRVLESISAENLADREQLRIDYEMTTDHGIWIAARAAAGNTQLAHTTPVYVRVGGGGFHNPDTAEQYLELTADYLDEIEKEIVVVDSALDHQIGRHQDALNARLSKARKQIEELRKRIAAEGADS